MAAGRKTGGRAKGTPNRKTLDLIQKLENLNCDPVEGMVRIAQKAEAEGDQSLAARMYQELCPYILPKRRAIEQTIRNEEGASRAELEANLLEAKRQLFKEFEAMTETQKQAFFETEH